MLNCPPSPRALAINQAKVAKVAKAQAASSSSSAAFGKISSPSGTYKQPRGRAPKDHVWDSSSGVWVHTETGSARSSIGKSHAVDFDWSHEDLDGDELMHKVMDGLKVLDDKISHVIGRQHQQIQALQWDCACLFCCSQQLFSPPPHLPAHLDVAVQRTHMVGRARRQHRRL